MDKFVIEPIAHIRTEFKEKFGIPRQSGLVGTKAVIIFEKEKNNTIPKTKKGKTYKAQPVLKTSKKEETTKNEEKNDNDLPF